MLNDVGRVMFELTRRDHQQTSQTGPWRRLAPPPSSHHCVSSVASRLRIARLLPKLRFREYAERAAGRGSAPYRRTPGRRARPGQSTTRPGRQRLEQTQVRGHATAVMPTHASWEVWRRPPPLR